MTKLAVLSVNANDPAWDAVQKDDPAVVTGLIEKSLGLRKAPVPEAVAARKALAPEVLAARKAAAEKLLEAAKARSAAKAPLKLMDRTPGRTLPDATGSELPDRLAGLPSSFFGGD